MIRFISGLLYGSSAGGLVAAELEDLLLTFSAESREWFLDVKTFYWTGWVPADHFTAERGPVLVEIDSDSSSGKKLYCTVEVKISPDQASSSSGSLHAKGIDKPHGI